jgi:hypothetical protein
MLEATPRSKGNGFHLDVNLPDLIGNTSPIFPNGLRSETQMRAEPVIQPINFKDRVELFMYFIKYPHLDYWVWDRAWRVVDRFVDDWDAVHPVSFMDLNPDLNFIVGTPSTDPATLKLQYKKALFETLKNYFYAIHYFVGSVANALLWANMRGFPIAQRLMNELKLNTITSMIDQLQGFPMSSAVYRFLVNLQRVLVFQPSDGVLLQAYPMFTYEFDSYIEGVNTSVTRKTLMPSMYELADVTISSYTGYSNGYMAHAFSAAITRSSEYLLDTLGFNNKMIKINSKLRTLMDQIGLFDATFDLQTLLDDVNAVPLVDGMDFMKYMVFADKPRPILKHKDGGQFYGVTNPEDSLFGPNPLDYILDSSGDPNASGVLTDNYEYLVIPKASADFDTVINTQDWSTSANIESSLVDTKALEVVGGAMNDHILKEWFKPYRDFWVDDPDMLKPDEVGERGLQYMARDEYSNGLFMPRYAITPVIDNFDVFQCGFYKVCMEEWKDADDWSKWAFTYKDHGGDAPWGANYANLWDTYFWVGGSFMQTPSQAFHSYLAAQASHFGTLASPKTADKTLAAMPFLPITYAWFWNSVAFAATGWTDSTLLFGADDMVDFDHTYEIAAADRRGLWYALDFPDPNRPHQVRLSNWSLKLMTLYKDRVNRITEDFTSYFVNAPVKTVSLPDDMNRYLSKYRQMGVSKTPLNVHSSSKAAIANPEPTTAVKPQRKGTPVSKSKTITTPVTSLNDAVFKILGGDNIGTVADKTLRYIKSKYTFDQLSREDPAAVSALNTLWNAAKAGASMGSDNARDLKKKITDILKRSITAIDKRGKGIASPGQP